MTDQYEIVWKEGSFFEKGGWRIQKKSDSGGEIVAFFLIAALVFFVVCIAVMTLALIGPLFVIWQMHKRLRYVGGIVGIIGFIYFLIDLQKEWISSVLFYGWTNDDGEFNNGVLGEDALSIFWVINIVGILVSTWLTFEHLLKEKDLSFDSYNLKRIRRRYLFLTDSSRRKRLKKFQRKPVRSAKKSLKAAVAEKQIKQVKKSSNSKINLIGGLIFGVILLGSGLYVFVNYSRYDELAIKTSGKSYTDLDERDKINVQTLANHMGESEYNDSQSKNINLSESKNFKEVKKEIFKVKKDSSSSLVWTGSALGKAHFGTVDFEGSLSASDGKLISGLLIFDIRSINTQDIGGTAKEKLDNHLKNKDFFNIEKFPSAQLAIKGFDGKNLTGDLTIKEVTKEITFPAALNIKPNSITGKANFTINRTDYGILYGSGSFFDLAKDKIISDEIEFNVAIKAVQEGNQAEDFGLNEINYYVDEVNTNDAEIEESVEVNSEINLDELTIIGDDIWVRSDPLDGEVVMHLYEGDRCEVISKCCYQDIRGTIDYWYEIEYNNERGWVFGSQTSKAEAAEEIEVMDDCIDCHTVQSGESVYSIAEDYSITVEQLEQLNPQVKNRWISTGMKLHVYTETFEEEGFDEAPELIVGMDYLGGVIVYILQYGDRGYVEGETHGFIIAKGAITDDSGKKCGQFFSKFSNDDQYVGGTQSGVGWGAQNTDLLAKKLGPGSAAYFCASLSLNGYRDWFLPSRDELQKVYENYELIGGLYPTESQGVWSSSEGNGEQAHVRSFDGGGGAILLPKNYGFCVKPLRKF